MNRPPIQRMLSALEHYWRAHPELRLGQIIGNFASSGPYYYEDADLLTELETRMNEGRI